MLHYKYCFRIFLPVALNLTLGLFYHLTSLYLLFALQAERLGTTDNITVLVLWLK